MFSEQNILQKELSRITQQTFTCSKSTIETLKRCEILRYEKNVQS